MPKTCNECGSRIDGCICEWSQEWAQDNADLVTRLVEQREIRSLNTDLEE